MLIAAIIGTAGVLFIGLYQRVEDYLPSWSWAKRHTMALYREGGGVKGFYYRFWGFTWGRYRLGVQRVEEP